jgi:hypothetical protein
MEVVNLLGRIIQKNDLTSAESFLHRDVDYKKGHAPEGSNWRVFYDHWKTNKNKRHCN